MEMAFVCPPSDPGIEARTGFAARKAFPGDARRKSRIWRNPIHLSTQFFPYEKELGGYPHEKGSCGLAPASRATGQAARHSLANQRNAPNQVAW